MMKLYDFLASGNGYKVRLLLHQLEVPYDRIELDITKGESRTESFLALNPNGRVPALVLDDGSCIVESNAIQWYLADGTPLLPDDRLARARVLQWMFFEQYSHEPFIAVVRFWLHQGLGEEKRAEIAERRPRGYDALAVMENHLGTNDFFVTNTYSIADIALYAYTHVAQEGDFDLAPYPAVRRWLERVANQPRHISIEESNPGQGTP